MSFKGLWGVAKVVVVPVIKASSNDFAVTGDWTPATGDAKVTKDGGTVANVTTLPAVVAGTGSGLWAFTFAAAEMQAGEDVVQQVVDSATKAVEDQAVRVEIDYGVRSNTAQAGAAGTITLDASASATDNLYNQMIVHIVGGTGVGQARVISSYVGSTKVATVDRNWVTNPNSTSIFRLGYEISEVMVGTNSAATASALSTAQTDLTAIIADTNELQGDWANTGRLDTLLDAIPTTAMRGTENAATASALSTAQTDLTAIKADTNELQVDWANGGRLDVILDARMAEASISTTGGAVDTVTTVTTTTTNTDMLTAAAVNAEVDTALVTYGLDHLVFTSVTGTDIADNSIIAKLASKSATADWDTFVNTTDSLEAILDSGGGAPTAAAVADAVWDELQSAHVIAGSFGIIASEIATLLVNVPNVISLAAINAEVDTAIVTYGLDHLVFASVTGTDIADNSIIAKLASKSATADWDTFVNTTDSFEAISDQGGGTVDGLTLGDYRTAVLSVLCGIVTISGSTASFKKRDGTTEFVSITVGAAAGIRSASTILGE